MLKTIAVIGRPNVGKSTLYNTILSKNTALTSSAPGLTRDRTYSYFHTDSRTKYLLIDTGGIIFNETLPIEKEINMQVDIAIDEADLLLFVVDIKDGLLPADEDIAGKIRSSRKPVILVVNKSDNVSKDIHATDFYKLGFDNIIPVSSKHKRNINDLIDLIMDLMPVSWEDDLLKDHLRLCIAGRPNVGKSTLFNKLVKEERVIVDDTPGTTRNPVKHRIIIDEMPWEIIDIAGLARRNRGKETEEILSMIAARKEIEKCNACIFLLDLTQPLTFQDSRIANWIIESGKPLIIAGNKMDLLKKKQHSEKSFHQSLLSKMPFLGFAPFFIISAKQATGIESIKKALKQIRENTFREISPDELDIFLKKILIKRPPPKVANIRPQVISIIQENVNPPEFKILINHYRLDKIPKHWINYVKNSLHKEFKFFGIPLTIRLTGKKNKTGISKK
ncbi:ribosome biogenesis GTPase Der [Elusimicrobiota bacterium]